MKEEKNRDWSALPSGLLVSVAEHLHLADVARIPAVCGCWAWALGWARRGWSPPPAFRAIFVPLENSSPWLLLPNDDGVDTQYRDFIRLSQSQSSSGGGGFPRIRISPLPEMASRICVGGSPDGWIATIDMWLKPKLLNPLTREEFLLPSLCTLLPYNIMTPVYSNDGSMSTISCDHPGVDPSFEKFKFNFVRKIILSSAPPFGIAFLFYGHSSNIFRLAMARVGDMAWTPVLDSQKFKFYQMSDVVYNKDDNKFYAVCRCGRLVVIDLKNYHWGSFKPAEATVLSSVMCRELLKGKNYVVYSSGGDLLQVWRKYKCYFDSRGENSVISRQETRFFKIFKFDHGHYDGKDPNSCWVQVKDLGDDAMFLGLSCSSCVTTIDKPWLKKNSVYFVEDLFMDRDFTRRDYTCDGGIFCLKDNKIERLFFPSHSKVNWPLPAWFTPSRLQFIL